MADLKDTQSADPKDSKKSARMKIVREMDGKRYGALQE